MSLAAITRALRAHRFRYDAEAELQEGIGRVLTAAGIGFEREVSIGRGDRIDFVAGGVGIEVKRAGGLSAVTRQLHRYAQAPTITALVLVTDRMQLARLPDTLAGKPVQVVSLLGGLR